MDGAVSDPCRLGASVSNALDLPATSWSTHSAELHQQRDEVAKAWISMPSDLLEGVWSSPLGAVTAALVMKLRSDSQLQPHQIDLRDRISRRLQSDFQSPMAHQLLIASFVYSPVGKLKIANANQLLPAWLASVYTSIYESEPAPVVTESTSSPHNTSLNPSCDEFPLTLLQLTQDKVQLNRLLGLANLHYIDPDDQEITSELLDVRRKLAYAINRTPESELEQLWKSDLGDRYWSVVRSGIQYQELTPDDDQIKSSAADMLTPSKGGGFGRPGALNSFLVSMLYFLPGTMQVEEAEAKLPPWLLQNYNQIFKAAVSK